MNTYQQQLWTNLMSLVETNEAFYFVDQVQFGRIYRIFNYRLASYTDFCLPDAEECRGSMFEIQEDGSPVQLAALPMEKFYNLFENPKTMNLDLSQVEFFEDKADGSLISTYKIDNSLFVKTKGSLFSDQAVAANSFLKEKRNQLFYTQLLLLARRGMTTNMEWVAPDNRIVLPYAEADLRVLNIRSMHDGSYIDRSDLDRELFGEILDRWTPKIRVADPVEFIAKIPKMQQIEGFIAVMKSGQRFKIKTEWYLALHHTKDSITVPRRLFEAVLEEASDDLKSLFHDDPLAIKQIEEMENFVENHYNHMVASVENFYNANKHLDRKDFAILGQQELSRDFFGLAMMKYTGKPVDFKGHMKGKWKSLGLKDSKTETE